MDPLNPDAPQTPDERKDAEEDAAESTRMRRTWFAFIGVFAFLLGFLIWRHFFHAE